MLDEHLTLRLQSVCSFQFHWAGTMKVVSLKGAEVGVWCDNDGVDTGRDREASLMRTSKHSESCFFPGCTSVRCFKVGQPIRYGAGWCLHFAASTLPANHLLHQCCRCSSLHRLMHTAALITAGVNRSMHGSHVSFGKMRSAPWMSCQPHFQKDGFDPF